MARRSQCSNAGDNPLDPNYLPPHYREEYRLAIDSLVEEDVDGYYEFLQRADVVDFLSPPEITYIQSSIQLPRQGGHPQHPFLETGGDGSSDTYWPIHSDLDAPGLDLGWPQMHHFGGPAEVTTLVNPPEPDMPSIKEQARRLIKNSQQVIAIVMDTFTDVDIFADLLNAAMRNVAVYILLDEQNVHLFINMVSNCRVNLQAIQFLRVRTVCGITYHCRSGKTFKGQMMDRFILTDCRAVLSGNYSFMWSFEKLHRCMAHLFLGQLVSTFDEEFRILFAQSQPLILENPPAQMEDYGSLQKRPYLGKRTSLHREPKKFMSLDTAHPDDWPRHSYDERMDPDRGMVHLKRHESLHGPADFHGRFSPQQTRKDPHFDQGASRLAMLENPALKRHSYAEGGRYTFLQQQGLPDHEAQGRQFHRGQLPNALPGPEAEYGGYEKFWNQDYHSSEQFTEPALPPDLEPPDNFDPVLNYLSSTRNVDFDQGPEKLQPPQDLTFGSPYARRLSAGQVYACQTSPTPSSSAEEKPLLPDPNADRKDPKVKRGLRNWRISSYLNTYDNPGDEGLPSMTPPAPDAFEVPSHPGPPVQQAAPGIDLVTPKIPNVREFKVPAVPRVSQIPGYVKTTSRDKLKKQPDENPTAPAEVKTTPTPSESSSTTEGDKTEEAEPKESKTGGIRREESFRRNYNAAVQRSSRLRSSLIFSSLEDSNQDAKTASGQEEDDSDQKEGKAGKLPFVSHVLGKRRTAREPFEWSRFIKSSTADKAAPEASKPDDGTGKAEDKEDASKENDSKDVTETPEVKKSSETTDVPQSNASPSVPSSKPSESEISKTTQPIQPPKSLLTSSLCVDMNDPDTRLMFFKELAAKRKAAKAAEAEKSKEKAPMKTPTDKKEEQAPKETSDKKIDSAKKPTTSPEGGPVKYISTEDGDKTGDTKASAAISDKKKKKQNSLDNNEPCVPKSCENNQTSVSAASEIELKKSPSETRLLVSADSEAAPSPLPETPKLPEPAVKECILTATTKESSATVAPAVAGADKNKALDSTSKESSLMPNTQTSEKAYLKTSISTPALPSDSKKAHASSPQSTSTPTVSSSAQEDVGSNPVGLPEPIRPSSPIALHIIEETLPDFIVSPDAPNSSESAQSDSASHLISSQSTPVSDAESGVSNNKCGGASGVDTSEAPLSDSKKDAPGSESSHMVQSSPKDTDRDVAPPSLSSSTPESCLPALDTKAEQKTTPPPVDTPPESTTDFPVHSTTSGKMPESEACESSTSETPAPADNAKPQMEISKDKPESGEIKTDPESTGNISQSATQESVCNDKTNGQVGQNNCSDPTEVTADETGPQSPQSKQQKSNQLRYHSSTANVLSSSNLRDDTKLLLEQISANSQSRNEAPKEAPVTDDEKEDEADKNAQREKERGIRSLSRGQPKDPEEREKLLERIQSMRKERKVYSRFEMAP